MPDLILAGCQTRPLSGYLKALGVLRLVAEQEDKHACGWWDDNGYFILRSRLDKEALAHFFCRSYQPTPVVTPWNGGSGFYLGDNTSGIETISNCDDGRFAPYRQVIGRIRSWPEIPSFETVADLQQVLQGAADRTKKGSKSCKEMTKRLSDLAPPEQLLAMLGREALVAEMQLADIESLARSAPGEHGKAWKGWWNKVKKVRSLCNNILRNDNKDTLLPACRNRLPERVLPWLDAVYALSVDGVGYNPLLGTGGNDGRLDLGNTFMQMVADLLLKMAAAKTMALAEAALFNRSAAGLPTMKIGQFDPGKAGGYNQGMEVETKDFKANPWDYLLAIEGSLVLDSSVNRRLAGTPGKLAVPFTVHFSPVGFLSGDDRDESRGELWLPLWHKPIGSTELKHLFREGRAVVGRRRARTGLDFARAVGSLGVDRGFAAFERYAYLQRRGKSFIALPAGQLEVHYQPRLALLEELEHCLQPADSFLRQFKSRPISLDRNRRSIDQAVFSCCQRADREHFCALLRSLGRFEFQVSCRDRKLDPALGKPLGGLSLHWLTAADDGSVEFRLAAALASIMGTGKVGPLRANLSPVDPVHSWKWATGSGQQHWFGNTLVERLAGVMISRQLDAKRHSLDYQPLAGRINLKPEDVMPLARGETDDHKIEELLFAMTLMDWRQDVPDELLFSWRRPATAAEPLLRTWSLLKLLHLPGPFSGTGIKTESRIARLLLAGRLEDACRLAINRLLASGLRPFRVEYREKLSGSRLLAALLVPVSSWRRFASLVVNLEKININSDI